MTTPANLYCSRGDVVAELPIGGIISQGITASASSDTDTLESDGHGFETDTPLLVRTADAVDADLPAPLVDGTTYYAIRVSNSSFKLSATQGGSAIDLTTDASEVVISREPRYEETIEFYSRWADDLLPAEVTPLAEPINVLVKGCVARLCAKHLMNTGGQDSAAVRDEMESAKTIIERHAQGLPLRGATTTTSTNKAITARGVARSRVDPRGWGCGGI